MAPVDNLRATSQELVSFARQQGIDLEPFCKDSAFEKEHRFIFFWRKDEFPCTGPANEPLGTLHYNMQGAISELPSKLKDSVSAFRGAWTEAGTFDSLEQAFALLKAWLLDQREVDDLPNRRVRRYGI
jgi:hypothetical protein